MSFIIIGFRVAGVKKTRAFLQTGGAEGTPLQPEAAERVIRAARRSLLMVKRATGIEGTCLSRSFALQTMLRRRGVATELQIGYRRGGSGIEGHAWLERHGQPVNEQPEVTATYTLAAGTGRIRWI